MNAPRFIEDVDEGMTLPPLRKEVTPADSLRYHIAARATGLIHFDSDYARNSGLPGVIISGHMRISQIAQLITDWIGEWGTLRRLSVRQLAMDMPGHPLIARGRVARKYVEGEESLVDLEVWIENEKGGRTCGGTGTVVLPSRPLTARQSELQENDASRARLEVRRPQ